MTRELEELLGKVIVALVDAEECALKEVTVPISEYRAINRMLTLARWLKRFPSRAENMAQALSAAESYYRGTFPLDRLRKL